MAERPYFADPQSGVRLGARVLPSTVCPPVPARRDIGDQGLAGAAFHDPLGMAFASQLRDIAKKRSEERFPNLGGDNDAQDAFRHFYGASTLARLVGSERARNILNSVEVSGGNGQADQRMDTWNTHAAITMGLDPKYRGMPVDDIFDIALKNGCLIMNK